MNITGKIEKQDDLKPKIEQQVKKGLQFIGSRRIQNGHTLYEFNVDTRELKSVEIEKTDVFHKGKVVTRKKVNTEENCQYFGALNRSNAIKKLNKLGIYHIK